jgi:glutathione synthase/RimK-type ligase-like ATP-grasp enzyme
MSGGIAFYRSLLLRDPGLASVRADLAQTLLLAGDLDGAIAEASAALDRDPSLIHAWLVRATARKAQCLYEAAARDFERAAPLAPERPMILVNLANSYAEIGRLDDAERVLRRAVAMAPGCMEAQASLGSVLVKQGRLAEAEAPCRAALALDPELIGAHQNLSGILATTDHAAARAHRDAAYGRQQIFIARAPRPERTVLVLAAADPANVPLQHLLARATTTVIQWYVEYATVDQDAALPHADLVFNAIGDPDLAPTLNPSVARVLHAQAGRVLNHPAKVALTRRCDLPRLLAGIPGIVVPPVIHHTGGRDRPAGALASAAMAFPVLVRPLGSHGGEGVRKCDDAEALAALAETASYVTEFVDCLSADGWDRKYRAIFVDGKPYAYHLAIANHWLVHYWTAGMEHDADRREEEHRFLTDPGSAIGVGAMAALGAIGERLGLDFAGIDFGLLPDGRLLVFEANATMLIHPEREACFAYRNPAVHAIQSAFDAMLTRRTCVDRLAGCAA